MQASLSSEVGGLAEELDRIRRTRLSLVATVAAVMSVVILGAEVTWGFSLKCKPEYLERTMMFFHAGSFLVAAFLFRIKSLHTQTILALDLLLFATNIIARAIATIVFVETGDHFPGIEGILLALVLHGVFVPTRVFFAIALGIVAIVSFPVAQIAGYAWIPSVHEHWNQIGEGGFSSLVILNTISISFFAFIGYLSSKLFYGLTKDAYAARQLGNYILQKEIATGGMGKIFVAKHRLLRRLTAVKVMKREQLGGEEAMRRFEREVDLASSLSHPNTISIYDFGFASDGTFYYAMEFLNGLNLQELVEKHGPVPVSRALYFLSQICGSLQEAHSRGIIHRDIKPNNIFITCRGGAFDYVKVIDFGLAKKMSSTETGSLTEAGRLFGTPHYMAPESVQGADQMDRRSDIYSLGAVIYWLVTGRPLFEGEAMEVLVHHVNAEPTPPSRVSELPIPPEMDQLILKCLAKKREDRFDTITALSDTVDTLRSKYSWTRVDAEQWWKLHHPEIGRETAY